MGKTTCAISLFAFALLINSCTTYIIPVDSFRQQFSGLDSTSLRDVTTRGPAGDKVTYKAYPIDYIHCIDSKGNPFDLPNGPSIEIRFTDSNNRRTIFYFDLLRVNEHFVTGIQSRFIPSIKKTISLDKVKKIEVQDGRKNFHYVNRPTP